MQLKNLLPLALGSVASAQSLLAALASQNATLSTLNSLLAANPSVVSALSSATNITVLAPNNAALQALLSSSGAAAAASEIVPLLTYHVLNGTYYASAFTTTPQFIPTLLTNTSYSNVTGGQRVEALLNGTSVEIFSGLLQKSTVVTPNINFTGGVIHIIDTVLTIPESDAATATAANLTALVGALTTTNLAGTVDDLSDVTIFAPSNAAFEAIGSAVGSLTTAQLATILEYHVINGTVGYSSLLTNESIPTVAGINVTITIEDGSVFVNSAKVITPNVLVANGVVHVIDAVLNPNNTVVDINPSTTTAAFSGASSGTGVPFTSGVGATTTAASSSAASTPPASSASAAGAMAMRAMPTGIVEMGALLGGAAIVLGGM